MAVLPVALLASPGPPPRIMTCWFWAGGSSTLADWSRVAGSCRPGTPVMVTGLVVRSIRTGPWGFGSSIRPPRRHPAVAEQEQVRVQGHAEKQATLRDRHVMPGVGARVVDLERGVQRAVLVQPADRQPAPIGQWQQSGVPAPLLHVSQVMPLLGFRVEADGVGPPLAGVGQVAAGRQQG